MKSTQVLACLLGLSLALAGAPGAALADGSASQDALSAVMTDGAQTLLDSPRNKVALDRRIDKQMIADLRQQLGRDLTDGPLDVSTLEGKSLREVMQQKAAVLKDNPQVLWALAHEASSAGDPLYASTSADAQPLEPREPGRIIPPGEMFSQASGPDGSLDKLKDYLDRNYGIDDAQLKALGAFLGLASASGPDKSSADGVLDHPLDPLKAIATPDQGATPPDSQTKGGLYVPGPDVLRRMSALLALDEALQQGADPLTARAPDGRSLSDCMAEIQKSGGPPFDPSQLKGMDRQALRALVARLARQIVDADLAANKPLIDSGQTTFTRGRKTALRLNPGDAKRGFPVTGNGLIQELNNKFYDTMIKSDLKPSERDALELDSGGDIFSIRGRPADIKGKHYDPPIDPHDAFFGSSMNLGTSSAGTANP